MIIRKDKKINDEYFELGRWISPVLEWEAWLDWCDTPESRQMGIVPDEINYISIDGHSLLNKNGAYPQMVEKNLAGFNSDRYDFAEKILDLAEELSNECVELADSLGPNATIEDLFEAFDLMKRIRFPWNACFTIGDAAEDYLKNYAEKNSLSEDLLHSQIPQLSNSVAEDQRTLFKLKQEIGKRNLPYDLTEIRKKDKILAEEIIEYQEKTEHFGTHHFWGELRTEERLMEAIENAHADRSEKTTVPDGMEKLFEIIALATRLRLECAQSSSKLAHVFRRPLARLAQEHGLEYEDIIFLTIEEIKNLDEKHIGKTRKNIRDRQKAFGISKHGGKIKITTGEEMEAQMEQFGLNRSFGDVREIKGRIGCKGKAKGIVVVALIPADSEKVKKGMILVAPETTPDFVPAMGRAAGFVTDRGGVTSHAAIIAREMGKPCIIGTEIGTQVLHDGDLVEVDADSGVVKIIEKVAG